MQTKISLSEALEVLGAMVPSGTERKSLPQIDGKRVRTRTMYISGLAADLGANNGQTILPSTKKETGITNFENGNLLPKGSNMLVLGARVMFDTTTDVAPKTAEFKSTSPAVFRNGELVFQQDGQGVLAAFSGTDISNSSSNRAVSNDDDFRAFEVPFMLRDDVSFDIQWKLAPGAVANIAYKIELRVVEFIDGDKV